MASAHDTADPSQDEKKRPYSIDLSLELERQLDNESLPPTPAVPIRPQSIDQTVLTSLVVQLRQTLAEVTSDREQLREQLARAESDKIGAEEALHNFTSKCAQIEDELEAARAKARDDDHAISMLRAKVEESRRGLMRLQTESRRAPPSSMSVDTGRAGYTTPMSSKRASFVPLTGTRMNGHKRISSVSDSAFLSSLSNIDTPGSPDSQVIILPDLSSSTSSRPPPVSSRRFSGFFGVTSPPQPPQDPLQEELEALRNEMKSLKSALEDTRHELSEANEAKEASETCAQALRDFIAQTQGAASYAELDLLPSQASQNKDDGAKKSSLGWSAFRMWKMEPPAKPVTPEVALGSRRMWKVDTTTAPVAGSSNTSDSSSSIAQSTPTATAPFTTKVGSLFGSRASVSSIASPPVSVSHPSRDSDVSSTEGSVNEPISPLNETPLANIMVRGSSASSSTEFDLPLSLKVAPDQAAESTVAS